MNKIIGHNNILSELKYLFKKNCLPKQILLNGKNGIGKSLVVNELLFFIYKDLKNSKTLILNNSHPNIFVIKKKDDKKIIEINQIREMMNFHNTSSFYDKPKIIVINDLEFLNQNSSNALLKVLEQPNDNTVFILVNNSEFKILETIKSRCIEFKLNLTSDEIKTIVNDSLNENIYDNISTDFTNSYNNPSFLITLVNYFKENNLDIFKTNIEEFLLSIISRKDYKNNEFINSNLNYFIELFFYKNISIVPYKVKKYFLHSLRDVRKYNLDVESYLYEFEEKLLSG